jgi:hypothetical protein
MSRSTTSPRAFRGVAIAMAAFVGFCLIFGLAVLDRASLARAVGGATWRFAPALAPPAPPGAPPAPYPVPVGEVGQISFWAPNRGLLITGGTEPNGPVAAGVYGYDGATWHQLSTVCGGEQGRIAWAGPDEFWTIADQRAGQILPPGSGNPSLQALSLCHFAPGPSGKLEVLASYAMPLGQPGSYLPMDAAACYGPSDCWFGGEDGQGASVGAFHLHWDGHTVTALYAPWDHAVTGMVAFGGELYESVQIGQTDAWLASEEREHPAIVHTIAPGGQASLCEEVESAFCPDPIFREGRPLPAYGEGVLPDALQGASLATDGSPLGEGATQLWLAANPLPNGNVPPGSKPAQLTVLRYAGGAWSQVLPNAQGSSQLPEGETLQGGGGQERGTGGAIAPEPGTDKAWLSLHGESLNGAGVALLNPDGTLAENDQLPVPQEAERVGYRGGAGAIACAAPHDCWLATRGRVDARGDNSAGGWLFHLTDGAEQPRDTDPFFDGEEPVITYRPSDGGVPVLPPDLPPVDNSLANQQSPPPPTAPPEQAPAPTVTHTKAKRLVTHVKSRFLRRRVLVISFTLTARAHVQLIGRRKSKIVAKTPRRSLKPGRHQLSLSLDPRRWPTKLQFKATPIGAPAPSESSGSESSGSEGAGPNSVGT